jgi:hypothetical protein
VESGAVAVVGSSFESAQQVADRTAAQTARPSGPHVDPRAAPMLALQRQAGNRAVAQAVAPQVQRAPTQAPAVDPVQALAKRQASADQDSKWSHSFNVRLSSWRQAIMRVTGGLNTAHLGFTQAKQDQATFDALVTQLLFASMTLGVATGFEPLVGGAIKSGKVGPALDKAAKTVEQWENPVVSVAGSASNVVPAAKGVAGTTPNSAPPQPPVDLGAKDAPQDLSNPMDYLTRNSEAVEEQSRRLERAFANRVTQRQATGDEAMIAFDVGAQEAKYAAMDAELAAASRGVEDLKSVEEVAKILERHIWARWLSGRGHSRIQGRSDKPYWDIDDWGSYIEDRFNYLGIDKLAGVELTGHWYSPNSPDDWARLILEWGTKYTESIGT